MLNVVYLVLVLSSNGGGMNTAVIPQANTNQCRINAAKFNDKRMSSSRYEYGAKAYCVAGVIK